MAGIEKACVAVAVVDVAIDIYPEPGPTIWRRQEGLGTVREDRPGRRSERERGPLGSVRRLVPSGMREVGDRHGS